MSKYREILESLGYNLKDHGQYWRTNAVYRSGDNTTALQIYKDTGVWKDYVEDSTFMPFEALLSRTLNTNDNNIIKSYLKDIQKGVNVIKEKTFLKEEKTYPITSLQRLLPHYDFYLDKNISIGTLKKYQCGFSTSGKMYQRTIFPIFSKDKKIHGFSGRKADLDENKPKWLHIGRVADWFYPFYSIEECRNSIFNSEKVFIVESIGDSLSLFDKGIKNNLVSFGLNISSKFISKLSLMPVKKIIVCFNNDYLSDRNRGFEGAIKSIFKLIDTIDFKHIYFIPPDLNDFGQMSKNDLEIYLKKVDDISHKESIEMVISIAEKMESTLKTNKSFSDSLKKLKKLYKFNYE
jgi:hypothetical protein